MAWTTTDLLRHRRPPQLFEQLHQVDFARGSLGQPAEIGELAGQPLEAIGLGDEHFERYRAALVRGVAGPSQLLHRDPHGSEGILDLVGDAPGYFAKGSQSLGFELAGARRIEGAGQVAQREPQ